MRLNAGAVSVGAKVYDGDRFSTKTGGMLLWRGDAATRELAGESEMVVRSGTDGAQGTEAELSKGTLAFRAARAAALEIVAREAHVRPAAEAPTIG